jgi:hypothetical protein
MIKRYYPRRRYYPKRRWKNYYPRKIKEKEFNENVCNYCGKEFDILPFICKFCGGKFCVEHRVPETHNCLGIKKYREEEIKKFGEGKASISYEEGIKGEEKVESKPLNQRDYYEKFITKVFRSFKYKLSNVIRSFSLDIFFKGFFKIPFLVIFLIICLVISKIVNSIFLEIGYSIEPYGFLSFLIFYAILFFGPLYVIYRFFTDMPRYNKIAYFLGGVISLIAISYAITWIIPKIPDTTFQRKFYVPNMGDSITVDMNRYQYLFYASLNKAHFMNWISQFTIFDNYLFKKNLPMGIIQELKKKYPSQTDDQLLRDVVSLVQNLDYDYSKLDSLSFQVRFPYETLYEEKGVCIEKTLLLLRLLEEMNYNRALITFYGANHAGVGVQCNHPNYEEFCFIESTNFFQIGEVPYDLRSENPSITRYGGLKRYKM